MAPMNVGEERMNAVRKAANAEAKMSEAQPMRKPPAPPETELATRARIAATNAMSSNALRSSARTARPAPAESSRGPKAQAGHVSQRRNQPQMVFPFVCLGTHSVTAWLPKSSTRAAVVMTPETVRVRDMADTVRTLDAVQHHPSVRSSSGGSSSNSRPRRIDATDSVLYPTLLNRTVILSAS